MEIATLFYWHSCKQQTHTRACVENVKKKILESALAISAAWV